MESKTYFLVSHHCRTHAHTHTLSSGPSRRETVASVAWSMHPDFFCFLPLVKQTPHQHALYDKTSQNCTRHWGLRQFDRTPPAHKCGLHPNQLRLKVLSACLDDLICSLIVRFFFFIPTGQMTDWSSVNATKVFFFCCFCFLLATSYDLVPQLIN